MTGIIFLILRFLIAACLYGFVAWAIFTLWKELQSQSQAVQTRPSPEITITCQENEELIKSFTTSEVNLGRDAACDFMVSDETISAFHARLSFHHNQWWLEDLQSTNGTFLNEERLYTPTVVMSGDELKLGTISLSITIKRNH
jgi:pSer/pThr/pTyr-binding forkhead associated (FHA) protein